MKNARALARVRCRLDAHLDMAKALQKLSARGLSKNGAMARVGFVDKRLSRLDEIRGHVSSAARSGRIKDKARDKVLKVIGVLIERSNSLRTKAMVQPEIDFDRLVPLNVLEQSLASALQEQHLLKVNSERSKNIRLTLSGGYQFEDEEAAATSPELEGFARASLSVKLGIFDPRWQHGKSQEYFADVEKLHEPGIGPIWHAVNTYEQNKIAISALKEVQSLLSAKLTRQKTKNTSTNNANLVEKVLGEIELVKLRSELLEVEVNLKTVSRAQRLLSL